MNSIRLLGVAGILAASSHLLVAQYQYPFQNPNLPDNQRIQNVLSLLTLQEKIDLLGKDLNVPRLGIYGSPKIDTIPGSSGQFEGLHGLAVGGPNHWGNHSPGPPSGPWPGKSTIPTTQFPQPAGLGQTWDPALLKQIATEEATEARYIFQSYNRGGLIIRAPNADLARDPRWGRSEESYGEDPFLVGTMSVAFVQGLQGNDPRYWLTASLVKHFLANSNEDGRIGSSSNFDARLLHEYYSVPFRMAIEQGGANALMTAYNAYNGIPMATSPLLRSMVMDRWGFNGMIDTDRGALTFMVTKHKYYPDMAKAAAGAIHAGVNQFLNPYQDAVKAALQQKLLTEADIDRDLQGVFRVMLRLGFLDSSSPAAYTGIKATRASAPWDGQAARSLALQATEESIVLLKNSANLLPLNASTVHSIAVVGPSANVVYLDGYSGTPPFAVTPFQGLEKKTNGARITVRYSPGGSEAVQLAKNSDVAIVVVGNRSFCRRKTDPPPCPDPTEGQEGKDRQQIHLKPDQEKLIQDVYAANRRTVVVLVSSFPYTIRWAKQNVPAVLQMANNSEQEGNALANVIFGDYNPSGHLSVTWPESGSQLPPMMDYNLPDGRTYMYWKGDALFPFGFGLSYTKFKLSGLHASASTLSAGSTLHFSVKVANTGRLPGDEVVQLYVEHVGSKIARPRLELKGFARVHVPAHGTVTATIPLTAKSVEYWDTSSNAWVLEKDRIRVMVGDSSANLKLAKLVKVQ